jgi:putative DeoR family transcriptional regulator (stage III sporulation protein D)
MKGRPRVIEPNIDIFMAACDYIVNEKTTIRKAARMFGISKSTLHYFIHTYYPFMKMGGKRKFKRVMKQLDYNWSQKHIRGGIATKKYYESLKQK